MKFVKAYYDTNYVDGDGNRTALFIFDANVTDDYIEDTISEYAQEFFNDHEYLADGYDVLEGGFIDEESEECYYTDCYYEWESISANEFEQFLCDEPDTEVFHLETTYL